MASDAGGFEHFIFKKKFLTE
ncbi:hypothetical protein CCACVL1_06457 [Corchorus capsularis]|uniref:Uncharacterized protein n=1 Tax=Corchorus capsularis TaxID=210143 RepID=A0A1R3JFA1_COCAP|nr:hypothetical protein CCACVL1_06457 [Corchorus capsularis]